MGKLTALIGFDARYVVYLVIALTIAGLAKLALRRYLQKWA